MMHTLHKRAWAVAVAMLLLTFGAQAADDPLNPSYPSIPPAYTTLEPASLINDARVNFGFDMVIEKSDGYQVTSPDGDTFYVDNIEQPNCAFYATYISNEDGGFGSGGLEVFSNVYIEEVNFENCQ